MVVTARVSVCWHASLCVCSSLLVALVVLVLLCSAVTRFGAALVFCLLGLFRLRLVALASYLIPTSFFFVVVVVVVDQLTKAQK